MISSLDITNFKAFDHASIRLAPYTLLSGLNSSGKSTVLQALALLRQGQMSGDDLGPLGHFFGVALNGELVELGTGQDVLHENYTAEPGAEPEIVFSLRSDDLRYACRIGYVRDGSYLPVRFHDEENYSLMPEAFTVFDDGFQYLRADRINPAVTYLRSAQPSERRRFLGARGEYTVDVLRAHIDDPVPDGPLRHPAAARPGLGNQTEAWLSEICPGVNLEATAIEHTDLVRLGFQFRRPLHPVSATRRPTNVGFGLTYVLPIIVACLTATPAGCAVQRQRHGRQGTRCRAPYGWLAGQPRSRSHLGCPLDQGQTLTVSGACSTCTPASSRTRAGYTCASSRKSPQRGSPTSA